MSHVAHSDRLPPRVLPLLYFGFAHLCLGAAFLFLALRFEALVGFFYHPQMIAVVHLVTLGWLSGSIPGAIYLVGPIAFRMQMPARRLDYLAFILFALGVTGTVGHFWIDSYSGMLGSAAGVPGQSESEDPGFDLLEESNGPSARTWVTTAAKGHHRRSSAVVFRRSLGCPAGITVTAVASFAGNLDPFGRVFFKAAFGSSLDL